MSGKNSKKAKRNGVFAAIWLLLILILIVVFLVKKDDFAANLKSTHFLERVVGSTPEFLQNYETKKKENKTNGLLDVDVAPVPGQKETQDPGTYDLDDLTSEQEAAAESPSQEKAEEAAKPEEKQEEKSAEEEKKQEKPKPVATTKAKLFFVQVDADGNVNRKSVVRQIPKSDSPLTDTIKALLAGPTDSEKSMTLIPQGTRLLSATVRNGIAALNFSEEFEFNAIGADGYRGQLMQIVFTATEFATVESVQFLIEGQRKEYIGSGEDVWMWIGSPYTRSSFN
ncbi:MAG: GerMN domain-containing protein [Treponema sp.]|nr:GerMN domain-containing protein [Treponema sp.]